MYIIQVPTPDKPYNLFVRDRPTDMSGFTRRPYDPSTKTWKTRAGAERWLADRSDHPGVVVDRGD